ncbi:hypothetical protein MVEN_01769900 [Mycena venus]|uniref:PARP catalytic domain-containing protein n=1 Tax=Mycena venus TaxID=2733690 RepID=A0A8H7CPC2_9AGAR|nr:hypothetical protein MVEN_01769900 [Mycena venus]
MALDPNNICLQCKKREKREDHQFCSSQCTRDAAARAPKLLKIPKTHVMFKKDPFTTNGQKTHRQQYPPSISSLGRQKLRTSFDDYRDTVELMTGETECKRFRSEKRACNLGEPGSRELCQRRDCHLCRAIRTGFKSSLEYKRKIRGPGGIRLGHGIYTTPSSSKAYQYAKNIGPAVGSDMRAVLYTRIVLGNPFYTKREDHTLYEPPFGYQSVIGATGKNSDFPDEECVVYHEDAIQPAYLIMLKN